jgi:hypothetical protein
MMWRDDDRIDAAIAEVAREMTEGEPRAGFTSRVLARIDEDRARARWPRWLSTWTLAPLAAAVVVVIAVVGGREFAHRTLQTEDRRPQTADRRPQSAGIRQQSAGTRQQSADRSGAPAAAASRAAQRSLPRAITVRRVVTPPSPIDALAPPPVDVGSIAVAPLDPGAVAPPPSIQIEPVDPVESIAVQPLGADGPPRRVP